MPLSQETVLYDVHDFKVYPMLTDDSAASIPTYGAAVDVPGIAEVSLDPNMVTAELKGDARVIARKGRVDRYAVSATYGKLDLEVLAVIMEGVNTTTGTTPNQVNRFRQLGDNALPYFKSAFRIDDVDLGLGAVRVVLYKCGLTGGTILGQSSDEFGQPTLELEAIPSLAGDIMIDVYIDETAVAL